MLHVLQNDDPLIKLNSNTLTHFTLSNILHFLAFHVVVSRYKGLFM